MCVCARKKEWKELTRNYATHSQMVENKQTIKGQESEVNLAKVDTLWLHRYKINRKVSSIFVF